MTFQHRAGVSPYTSPCGFARTCVFSKQSLLPGLCGPYPPRPQRVGSTVRAPLLPKLRGYFAEFLNHDSLARLSILYLTTCVGLGYGRHTASRRGFSRQYRLIELHAIRVHHHPSRLSCSRFCLGAAPQVWTHSTTGARRLPLCVTPVRSAPPPRLATHPSPPL